MEEISYSYYTHNIIDIFLNWLCFEDGEIWISKPTGMNQGKGIFLIRSREEIARLQWVDISESLGAMQLSGCLFFELTKIISFV